MIAFIQHRDGFPQGVDAAIALHGFISLGFDIKKFTHEDIISGKYDMVLRRHVFVGCVDTMTEILKRLGKIPKSITFPSNRNFNYTTLGEAISKFKEDNIPVFIKPTKLKLFDGYLVEKDWHISYLRPYPEDTEVATCDRITGIKSEYRSYVYKHELVDIRNYSGDIVSFPTTGQISDLKSVIKENKLNFPIAYTADIAITDDNMIVIEYNDFWAIGNYGIDEELYARMLRDRYFEMIK